MKRDIHNFNRRSRRRPALFVLWVTAQLGDIFPRAPLHGEEYAAVGAIRTRPLANAIYGLLSLEARPCSYRLGPLGLPAVKDSQPRS